MKRLDGSLVIALALLAFVSFARAEEAAPSGHSHGGAAAEAGAKKGECDEGMGAMKMGKGHGGPHECPMMGGCRMGGPGMGGCCGGGLAERGVDVKVDKRDDGVVLTLTSKDPKVAARIQKRAEMLRLRQELDADAEPAAP